MFYPADLFNNNKQAPLQVALPTVALPNLIERVSQVSKRPRYVLLILNLIAKAARENGRLGAYVRCEADQVPVRDWLCRAKAPPANRDCRRTAMIAAVRSELLAKADASENAGDLLSRRMKRSKRVSCDPGARMSAEPYRISSGLDCCIAPIRETEARGAVRSIDVTQSRKGQTPSYGN